MVILVNFLEMKSLSSYLSSAASALTAWLREHSECDHQLTDVESAQHSQRAVRSSPHTGSGLSGVRVRSTYAYGEPQWRC